MSNPTEKFWRSGGWPTRLRRVARAIIAALIVPLALAPRAWAEQPPMANTEGPGTAAGPTTGGAREQNALEERLRRLEALGAAFSEQNRRLIEQNRQLDEQNQRIARQLQDVNLRYDELARR